MPLLCNKLWKNSAAPMAVFRLSHQIADLESAIRLNRWMLRTNSLAEANSRAVTERLEMLEIRLRLTQAELETALAERHASAA
jgi:hypothetical protein